MACLHNNVMLNIQGTVKGMNTGSFFRWKPTSIVLWLFAILFILAALLNFWLAFKALHGPLPGSSIDDPQRASRLFLRGSAENIVIATLCIGAWLLMRRHSRVALVSGCSAVVLALAITSKRWVYWHATGDNPLPWFEPLLVWPPLAYAIAYAWRESRQKNLPESPPS